MLASEFSGSALEATFYPLEVTQKQTCSVDPATNLRFDPRYNEASLSITEYVLETTSGVTGKLQALPLFTNYV